MNTNSFNRQKRQFRNLADRVNQLVISGEWMKLTASTRNRIILKINSLYRQLSSYFTQSELKKILAAAAIFIGFPLASQAQSFANPQLNPFGLEPDTVYLSTPAYADIDHDGDFDLFTGNYTYYEGAKIHFFENTGTVAAPIFAPFQEDPFGISIPSSVIGFPAFVDIDNDEDLDMFLGVTTEDTGEANFQFYENIGTVTAPVFAAPQQNPFGLSPAYLFALPAFADIDNDGDLDLFTGQGYGNIKFYENTGTITDANFAEPLTNPFGLTPAYMFGSPAIADIDHDGDLDLFVGEYYGDLLYFKNTGTPTSPAFAPVVTNPFGLVPTYYYNFPAFADLDDDGDEDLLVGEYYGMFQYFENTEFTTGIAENPGEVVFDLYPNPASEEVYLRLMDNIQKSSLEFVIYNLAGVAVKTGSVSNNITKLETGNLAPGMYLVQVILKDKAFTRKLAIK